MKKIIKKIIPETLLQVYRSYKYSNNTSVFFGKSAKETFTQIYETNHWQGKTSISGTGSDELQTLTIINLISSLIEELDIKTILDLPCGDFNWMKHVNLNNVKYLGADIVDELIKDNLLAYSSDNIQFKVMNLISDQLPKVDLFISRDSLVHLSYEDIYESVKNIKLSGSKYLLTTTFPKHSPNYDICTGDWRTLNLEIKPFNFPDPIRILNENCTQNDGSYGDKSLGLYLLSEIKLPHTMYKKH